MIACARRAAVVLVLFLVAARFTASSDAFVLGTGARWISDPVMHLELGSSNGPLADGCVDWGQCAERAMAMWVPFMNGVDFRVVRNSTAPRADGDGVNVVFFSPDIYGDSFGNRTLAITLTWWIDRVMTDADVIFNSRRVFDSYRGPLGGGSGAIDFRRTAAHEFGHVLSLAHPDDFGQRVTALMNSTIGDVEALQNDDIAGVSTVYAPGIARVPTPGGPSLTVNFPPRNEPLDFRNQLESKYRDGLRRGATATYVDTEGSVVWMQEYLRYRVNQCTHSDAITRVFMQIDGFGVQPICGIATGTEVVFPPRDQSFDFGMQLEAKYRDSLHRAATGTFVNLEGNAVWTQEYLRLRVNGCGHAAATESVFAQIDNATPPCR